MLDGYKTYITGIATIAYALGGAIIGKVDWNIAIPLTLGALEIMGVRQAIPVKHLSEMRG